MQTPLIDTKKRLRHIMLKLSTYAASSCESSHHSKKSQKKLITVQGQGFGLGDTDPNREARFL